MHTSIYTNGLHGGWCCAEIGEHTQKALVKQQMASDNAIWRERPLPDHLVQYAVDDVRLLDKAWASMVCCEVEGGHERS